MNVTVCVCVFQLSCDDAERTEAERRVTFDVTDSETSSADGPEGTGERRRRDITGFSSLLSDRNHHLSVQVWSGVPVKRFSLRFRLSSGEGAAVSRLAATDLRPAERRVRSAGISDAKNVHVLPTYNNFFLVQGVVSPRRLVQSERVRDTARLRPAARLQLEKTPPRYDRK